MCVKITKLTPPPTDVSQKRYRPIDAAKAIGKTTGSVQNYVNQKLRRKSKDGITLDEIADYIGIMNEPYESVTPDMNEVNEIRQRLRDEKYILIEDVPE